MPFTRKTEEELRLLTEEAGKRSELHRSTDETFVGYCFNGVGINAGVKIVRFLTCRAVVFEDVTLAMLRLWDAKGELIVMSEYSHPYGDEAIAGAFHQIFNGHGFSQHSNDVYVEAMAQLYRPDLTDPKIS